MANSGLPGVRRRTSPKSKKNVAQVALSALRDSWAQARFFSGTSRFLARQQNRETLGGT